jgi:DNA-binding PadR family transcriptional regulator
MGKVEGLILDWLRGSPLREATGHELHVMLCNSGRFWFRPSTGALYAALAKLERDRLVTSRWIPGPFPRQRVYRLGATPG